MMKFLVLALMILPTAALADTAPVPMLRVAVIDFENKVPNSLGDLGSGMAEMLIGELRKTGRFSVLERAALAEILGEQDFSNSGRVQRGQQLAVGRVKGAQLLIKGAVTEFSYNVKNRNVGFGFRGVGIGGNTATARAAIDIRLIDPTSGEIVHTYDQAVEIEAKGSQVSGTLSGFSFSGGGSNNHPMGQAVRQLIEKSVGEIIKRLDTTTIAALMTEKLEGSIVKVDSLDRIVINRGSSDGVKVGDRLKVTRVVEELIDPETGELLSREKTAIGEIVVTEVNDRWSITRAVTGNEFARSDFVAR